MKKDQIPGLRNEQQFVEDLCTYMYMYCRVVKMCTNENFVWSMYEIVYFQNKLIDTILQVPEDSL
jgi:hypothetical protein